MQEVISITELGTITLPASIRKQLGLTGVQQLTVTTTQEGELLLRPATTVSLEAYAQSHIRKFTGEDMEISELFK